ncbi:hypothetical protein [Bradyrhizobium nanningense]|uniref:hypothetical protein n=1 Tax=Bradyrhizobium nanningense TaxID=1325118 RepID=UPI001008D7BF|nr:hypothetical protein [Bradyrhizobium nanningense]
MINFAELDAQNWRRPTPTPLKDTHPFYRSVGSTLAQSAGRHRHVATSLARAPLVRNLDEEVFIRWLSAAPDVDGRAAGGGCRLLKFGNDKRSTLFAP